MNGLGHDQTNFWLFDWIGDEIGRTRPTPSLIKKVGQQHRTRHILGTARRRGPGGRTICIHRKKLHSWWNTAWSRLNALFVVIKIVSRWNTARSLLNGVVLTEKRLVLVEQRFVPTENQSFSVELGVVFVERGRIDIKTLRLGGKTLRLGGTTIRSDRKPIILRGTRRGLC